MWKILILSATYAFLCINASCPNGWMRHDNSCYHFSHDQEDWPNAVAMCHILGGKLVEIESSSENSFLSSMAIRFNKNYWIGLTDIQEEGIWVWIESKSPISQTVYSNWHPGQPDNYLQNQNCATLNGQNNGDWYDWYCNSNGLPYICEKQDGEQEIVG